MAVMFVLMVFGCEALFGLFFAPCPPASRTLEQSRLREEQMLKEHLQHLADHERIMEQLSHEPRRP
jgi:hypothetical protein